MTRTIPQLASPLQTFSLVGGRLTVDGFNAPLADLPWNRVSKPRLYDPEAMPQEPYCTLYPINIGTVTRTSTHKWKICNLLNLKVSNLIFKSARNKIAYL
ncbi:hypothetical protein AVEN_116934-1 [Araneus ventricosus]|uniref:Uncharacterized protein n=1 Tax=Araneus ventricosus TaxID=182803 RepID=A0A4Y2RXC3_ARAVE|nr:hypothetical protein AVEN_116934-1 [Araneus ventricosus]